MGRWFCPLLAWLFNWKRSEISWIIPLCFKVYCVCDTALLVMLFRLWTSNQNIINNNVNGISHHSADHTHWLSSVCPLWILQTAKIRQQIVGNVWAICHNKLWIQQFKIQPIQSKLVEMWNKKFMAWVRHEQHVWSAWMLKLHWNSSSFFRWIPFCALSYFRAVNPEDGMRKWNSTFQHIKYGKLWDHFKTHPLAIPYQLFFSYI